MRQLRYVVSGILLLMASPMHAIVTESSSSENYSETLTEYLKNLGTWFGFDVTQQQELNSPIATLLSISDATLAQQYSLITLLGAIPVNAYSSALASFVPSNTENYKLINEMANYSFQSQPSGGKYSDSSTDTNGGFAVSSLIDQQTYQNDPVTQSVLNILTTPQTTYCMNNDATAWTDDCKYLYDTKITANVIGTLPTPDSFFSYDYNQPVITQLNSNALLGPLLYSTSNDSSTTSSSTNTSSDEGLTAQNQIQEAGNFIRYAARIVTPPELPKRTEYSNLYQTAIYDGSDATSLFKKQLAEKQIARYVASLRSYSAQQSLPIANLYSMLAKRMPQPQSSDSSKQTSQAFSEFQMATRRLYDPAKDSSSNDNSSKQWIDQINDASTATVQKEIAVLLSEINYQLYLSRQQDERMLATLSMMLIKSLSAPSLSDGAIDTSTESDDS